MPAKRASRPTTLPSEQPSPAAAEQLAPLPSAEAESTDAYRRRPRQSRGQARVELLLDAAAAVIAEQGLQAATAEAIALRARTAKGSLYQFFPNRDAVLAALALRYADELQTIYDRAFPIDQFGLPLDRLIDRIVKPLAEFHDAHPAFRRVFATVDAPGDGKQSAPSRLRTQLFDSFVDRLEMLFAARNPKLALRERRRIALVAASLGQTLLARRGHAVAIEKKPLLDDLRRILLAYLKPVLEAPAVDVDGEPNEETMVAPKKQ